jgi:cobalt-zinc-cadmium efflux system protein
MAHRHHDHDHAGHGTDPGHGHGHDSDHDHGHGSHSHSHARGASETRLGLAALLTGAFMLAEVIGGVVSGSLALIADAGHMLTDFASLSLAWYGFHLARRPADWKRTYGYDRFSILIAFANGLALFAIAAWIVVEAVHRLATPSPVLGGIMLAVALAGLVVNVLAFLMLRGGAQNLNVRAATLHVVGDMMGSVAALAAGLVILATGWTPIDPILSVLVAVIILRSAYHVVRDSGHILLEGAPAGLDTREIAHDLKSSVAGVIDVHHVHAWSISEERPMVTLHARIRETAQPEEVAAALKGRLKQRFDVEHATVEIEFNGCADDAAAAPVVRRA